MDDNTKQFLELYKRCDAFFKEVLDEAISNQHVQISQEAAFYLMGILLMGIKTDPGADVQSLAEKYLAAYKSERPEEFRFVGDASLIIAGIWWQSLLRKLGDVDYYIGLGSQSYQKASEITPKNLSELFEELSENFRNLVNILIEATRCVSEANLSHRDILRMYEVWLRTQNTFLAEKLKSLGVEVVPGKTTVQ